MLVVLPIHSGDQESAAELLAWIAELGGNPVHDLVVSHTPTSDPSKCLQAARSGGPWRKVSTCACSDEAKGHPWGANRAFANAVRYVEHHKLGPFLWLEHDAIPLRTGWLDALADEYSKCGKTFMGHWSRRNGPAPHMNGVGIWDRVSELAPISLAVPTSGFSAAFDVEAGPQTLLDFHETSLIQFVYKQEEELLKDESLAWLREDAVLFHTEKTHGLIKLLRARRPVTARPEPIHLPTPQPVAGHPILNHLPLPNVIYGFYGPVPEISEAETRALIAVWQEKWTAAGWVPIVLGPEHARAHPLYLSLLPKFEALPTINPKAYEVWCMVRWLAVAQVGGGWMSDFDVMPNGFKPMAPPPRITVWQANNPCPCLVSGGADDFAKVAHNLANFDPGNRAHCSDQDIIQAGHEEWGMGIMDVVKHYTADGWEDAKAIHFCNAVMSPHKQPRSEWIPRIMAGERPKMTRAESLAKARAARKANRK